MSEPTTHERGDAAEASMTQPRPTAAPTESDAAPKRRPITVTCDCR